MNIRSRRFLSIIGIAICLVFLLFAIKYVQDRKYRTQLPEYPDFQAISISLQNQISAAGRKAYINPTSNNIGKLGMVYNSSAYYEKAIQCYKLAVKRNPGKWIWSYYLGYLNLELGESNSAIDNFKIVTEKNPKNDLALFYTGEAYQNIGLSINAENIFKKIASQGGFDINKSKTLRDNYFSLETYAKFRLARIYKDSNRLDSAEIILKNILEAQMTFGPAYRLLGSVYAAMDSLTLAEKYTARANDLIEYSQPTDLLIDNLILISRSDLIILKQIDDAIRTRNFKWALKLCEHGLKYLPDNKFLISKAVTGYFSLGFVKEAIPYLDQHFSLYSDDFNEMMDFADVLFSNGFIKEAMKYFNQAKKLNPESEKLAMWLSVRNMTNESIILLNEQLEKNPGDVKILLSAVLILQQMGKKEAAMKYFIKLKRLTPSSIEVKKVEAIMAEAAGEHDKSLAIYEDVFKSDPKDLSVIKTLAGIYIRKKLWDKVILHYRTSLEYFPNEPFLQEGLGRLLISSPDQNPATVNEGREYSERAYLNYKSEFSTKIAAARNLATACAELGDKKKTLEYINITLDLAKQGDSRDEYISYFEDLKAQFKISN